jgi:hypothetical protein
MNIAMLMVGARLRLDRAEYIKNHPPRARGSP